MKKNYVQVRLQSRNNSVSINNIKHNLRTIKTKNVINDNDNILIFNNQIIDNNLEIKKQFREISQIRRNMIKEHTLIHRENNEGRKLDNTTGSISEGIITFSELIIDKQKEPNFKHNFSSLIQQSVNEICNKLDTEPIYISIHLDEKTPHCHFHFKNYDNEGKSITYKNKNKEFLSSLQDLVGEKFKDFGFRRGIKKDLTNKNYQTTQTYKEKQLSELNEVVESKKELVREIGQIYKNNIKFTKSLRTSISETDLSKEDKKIHYRRISDLQKILRNEQKLLKQEMKKDFEDIDLDKFVDKLKTNLKTLKSVGDIWVDKKYIVGGEKTIKITFELEDFNEKFKSVFNNLHNMNVINNEIKDLNTKHDKSIEDIKEVHNEEINELEGQIQTLNTTTTKLNKKIEEDNELLEFVLNQKKELEEENKKLKLENEGKDKTITELNDKVEDMEQDIEIKENDIEELEHKIELVEQDNDIFYIQRLVREDTEKLEIKDIDIKSLEMNFDKDKDKEKDNDNSFSYSQRR